MNLKYFVTFPVLVFCLLTTSAWADDPATNVSVEQAAKAKALLEEGNSAQKAGDFEKARDAYRQSFNLKRSYDTAANLGQVEFYLEMYRAAAEHLDYARRNYPTSAKREGHSSIEALLKETTPHVGRVQVSVDKPGATIFVNGERVGSSPLNHVLFVNPGKTRVRAELEGESDSHEFESTKGALVEIELKLARAEARSPSTEALPAQDDETADPGMERGRSKRNWVPAYVLGGVTVAALGTSMVFRGLAGGSSKKADDLAAGLPDDACTNSSDGTCNEIDEQRSHLETQAMVSNATLIGAAVLGAATLGYVIYQLGKTPTEPSIAASAAIGPTGGTLLLTGHF